MSSLLSKITSSIIFPVYHQLRRDGLWPAIRTLEANQWLPRNQLLQLQRRKLSALLQHCHQHVPYYQNIFKQVGFKPKNFDNYRAFSRIPFLTKALINSHTDELKSQCQNPARLIADSTSGSTGETLRFFRDNNSSIQRQAVVWRNQKWVSCLYTDRTASLWGAPFDFTRYQTLKGKLHAWATRDIFMSSYELSDDRLLAYAHLLQRFKPKLLISYPSPLAEFAQFITDYKLHIPPLRAIITSAESLLPWQRNLIQGTFRCRVFDRYGCREFGCIAQQCENNKGYHINAERFFIEVLDEDGAPCPEGKTGQLYITDLDNYGFPFVRYAIGDLATPTSETCLCGRGLPMLKSIEGRVFDVIVTPGGNRIAGTFWTILIKSLVPGNGVKRFQLVQHSLDVLELRIVRGEGYESNHEAAIRKNILEKCGKEMDLQIRYVENIALTPGGKQKIIVSKLGQPS